MRPRGKLLRWPLRRRGRGRMTRCIWCKAAIPLRALESYVTDGRGGHAHAPGHGCQS